MKFAVAVLLITCMLSGCAGNDYLLDQTMEFRETLLAADNCSFHITVTADYGKELYTFQMDCTVDTSNNLSFTVTDPESISGICGTISHDGAALTFDDKILAFPMLADGQLTPVSAPWIFVNTLKSGYLRGCGREEERVCIYVDDSFEENPLHLQIYTDLNMIPVYAEIIWANQRVLSADIRDFTIQ